MEEQTLTELITQARINIQAARDQLNQARKTPETKLLPWRQHHDLLTTRNNLNRGLSRLHELLLCLDRTGTPSDKLPEFLAFPKNLGKTTREIPKSDNAPPASSS